MNKELLYKLINASVSSETLSKSLLKDADKEFYYCLKEQTFLPMLYQVFKDERFFHYYASSHLIHEQFNKIVKEIQSILNENEIEHIFIKGSILKNLYPDENVRMFGDIDFIVKEKEYKKTISLLKNNGFVYIHLCEHHTEMKKDGLLIEVHKKLFDSDERGNKFFLYPFDHLKLINEYSYTLEDSFHFVYVVAHYAKHLSLGAGIRPIIDIYLMIINFNLDWTYINESLKELKLDKFFNIVLNEINIIFGFNDISFFSNNDVANELIDYSINSGIHGFGKNNSMTANGVLHKAGGNKFKYLLMKLFIPLKSLFTIYPWTKTIILIPFGYIYRFFSLLFNKQHRKKFKQTLKYKNNHKDILSKVGLSK